MSKNVGLFFRMENFSESEAPLDSVDALTAEADASADVAEVQSASGDVTEVATGIENAHEAQSELSSVIGTMQEAVDSGEGLTEREAVHLNARMERIADLMGADAADMGLSLRREHFAGKGSSLAATKLRLEKAEGWGKRIWDVIIQAWEWLKTAANTLIAKVLNTQGSQAKYLRDLKARLGALTTEKKKKDKVKYGLKAFAVDGKMGKETVIGLLKNAAAFTGAITELSGYSTSAVSKMTSNDSDSAIGQVMDEVAKAIRNCLAPSGALLASKIPGVEGATPGFAIGNNKAIYVTDKKTAVEGRKGVTVGESKLGGTLPEDYPAFSKSDLEEIVDLAIKVNDNLGEYKKVRGAIEKAVATNISYIKSAASNAASVGKANAGDKKEDKKAANDAGTSLKEMTTSVSTAVNKVLNALSSAQVDLVSSASSLVAGGLGNLGGKGDDAPAGDGGGEAPADDKKKSK